MSGYVMQGSECYVWKGGEMMGIFEYDPMGRNGEYYDILQNLIERWEYEVVEFKEAKGQYSEDKIGRYFSAISNEANLKNQQYGWLVLGVSEDKIKHPVGTAFKSGNPELLEKFKYEISKEATDGMTFLDIIELYPVYEGKKKRILMFKVPAANPGMPTEWKTRYYARNGESLVPLQIRSFQEYGILLIDICLIRQLCFRKKHSNLIHGYYVNLCTIV